MSIPSEERLEESASAENLSDQSEDALEEVFQNMCADTRGTLSDVSEDEGVFPLTGSQSKPWTSKDDFVRSSFRCYGMLDVHNKGSADSSLGLPARRESPPNPMEGVGLRGLRNVGNSCFMNSIIQCLSNTEELLALVLSSNGDKAINKSSSMKGELFLAFAALLRDVWDKRKHSETDTSTLKKKIEKFCPQFQGNKQHDSQELLRFFLDGLHNDVNRIKTRPTLAPLRFPPDANDEFKARLAWNHNLRFDDSLIADIFVGQLKSTLKCLGCGYRSVTFDPFWDLSVSIPSTVQRGTSVLLQDVLALFTQEETLDGKEMPICASCGKQQKATKKLSIQKFPDVLVIHLKRFTKDSRGKLRTVVKFPLENLDMGIYSEKEVKTCSYNLVALSNHCGTPSSGHYIAYARHPYSKEWHQYDDACVSPCAVETVSAAEAYLLFYGLSLASKSLMER